jgi:NB-ARC domain
MGMDSKHLIDFVNTAVFHETQRHLRDVEVWILEGAWNGQTYKDIAQEHNYTSQYLSQDIGPRFWKLLSTVFKEDIKKCNFRSSLERHFRELIPQSTPISYLVEKGENYSSAHRTEKPVKTTVSVAEKPSIPRCHWGEAPDTAQFFGRTQELNYLEDLISNQTATASRQRCRLISLLGMGGMGKTMLASQLAHTVANQFDIVIWRSLRNPSNARTMVRDLLQCLNSGSLAPQNTTFSQDILQLLDYLRQYRCLLILDNFDTVLKPESSVGAYQPQFEEYGLLVRCLADADHQSCVMLTSRTKPKGLLQREGIHLSVRSFTVPGLSVQDIAQLFQLKGCHGFNRSMMDYLTTCYGGNPFILSSLASAVKELSGGNVADCLFYLKPKGLFFSEVEALLHQQLLHLGPVEKELMGYFVTFSGSMTLPQLLEIQYHDVPKHLLTAGLQSLLRRSLIEQQEQNWLVQPYILNYFEEHFMGQVMPSDPTSERPETVSSLLADYRILEAS